MPLNYVEIRRNAAKLLFLKQHFQKFVNYFAEFHSKMKIKKKSSISTILSIIQWNFVKRSESS